MNLQQKILTLPKRRLIPSILAACVLFSGVAYASNLLVSLNTSQVRYEVSTNTLLNVKSETTAHIRNQLQSVNEQLTPGETAYVYLSEMEKLKLPALHKITNPKLILNINEWKLLTSQDGSQLKTPTTLPVGYSFASASLQAPIAGLSQTEFNENEKALKKQAKQSTNGIAWVKTEVEQQQEINLQTPILTYKNSNLGAIEVSYQHVPALDKQINIQMMVGDGSSAEPVLVSGVEGTYLVSANTMFSEAGNTSTIQWMERVEETTTIYRVSSSSPEVSKQDLLLVANSLK